MLSEDTSDSPQSSSNKGPLIIPRIHSTSTHGAFSHYDPTLWNATQTDSTQYPALKAV